MKIPVLEKIGLVEGKKGSVAFSTLVKVGVIVGSILVGVIGGIAVDTRRTSAVDLSDFSSKLDRLIENQQESNRALWMMNSSLAEIKGRMGR